MGFFEKLGFGGKDKSIPDLNTEFVEEETKRLDNEKREREWKEREAKEKKAQDDWEAEKRRGETSAETARRHGLEIGSRFGADEERAWRSGQSLTWRSAVGQEYKKEIEKFKEGLSEEDVAEFDKAFKKGRSGGSREESKWQSAHKDLERRHK